MLSPLVGYPRLQSWLVGRIVDTWNTSARVARLAGVGPTAELDAGNGYAGKGLDLVIVHALNDVEIPWYEGRLVWTAATGGDLEDSPGRVVHKKFGDGNVTQTEIWENGIENAAGKSRKLVKRVRWERGGYGGMFLPPVLVLDRFADGRSRP